MISGRAKRILVYTVSLLTAPIPMMPYEKGTREYVLAMAACAFILTLSSFYVARGELKIKPRMLVGTKLLSASLITLIFGIFLLVGSLWYLCRA